MKSKLLVVFYGVAFLTLGLIVTSFIRAETPTSVAQKFLNAMDLKQYETAKNYCTVATRSAVDEIALLEDSREAGTVKRKFTGETKDGDSASVKYINDGEGVEKSIQLLRVDGVWLIAMTKDDFLK